MRRYYLKLGDKSTSGGTVVEGIEGCYHHGTQLTFLGAQVYCPACKTTGRIVPKGPRWPDNLMGKHAALDGDLCVCRCNPPPVMLPSQTDMCETFDAKALELLGYTSHGTPLKKGAPEGYDERFLLINSQTGEPLANAEYAIERGTGEIEHGITNQYGQTHLVSATSHSETVHIYI
ncbi:PAAR domain-containing protein [uncultured Herbaspirillum sp.]|uniref:PAAR domain-containing protein n=1 Tax=uncultured Herbaspirillum sp. TaxID=160236 RepID=UPI0033905AE4